MRRFRLEPEGDGLDVLARALARPGTVVVSSVTRVDGMDGSAVFLARRDGADGLVPVACIAGPVPDVGGEEVGG